MSLQRTRKGPSKLNPGVLMLEFAELKARCEIRRQRQFFSNGRALLSWWAERDAVTHSEMLPRQEIIIGIRVPSPVLVVLILCSRCQYLIVALSFRSLTSLSGDGEFEIRMRQFRQFRQLL